MKKLPSGISNYNELVTDNYYYVDKTKYIETLENLADKRVMYLRPRKFGKTLFTSVLEYYYDINAKEKFDKLFRETYIGKNPTKLKNSYYILRFNFSGIDTSTAETTIKGFKNEVASSIELFCKKYQLNFNIDKTNEAENILDNFFKSFFIQENTKRIYVIIDEYDHFANELLGFDTEKFKSLVSKNEKVRKWYEVLKKGAESVVDRIFITGVAPITLDSLTSGFNISRDITQEKSFNEMIGFSTDEVIELMESQGLDIETQQILLPIMKENYDGYTFSIHAKEKVYNSNMCLYFLDEYVRHNSLPSKMVDINIASDYEKIGRMLNLYKGKDKSEIIEQTVGGEEIINEITSKFNPALPFTKTDLISMLYYLGYLTIVDERVGRPVLKVPNTMMREIYADFFMTVINNEANLEIDENEFTKILEEIALEGKVDTLVEVVHTYLNNLSNRDFERFDEKYVKVMFFCIVMHLKQYFISSEAEVGRKYIDILITPKDFSKGYHSILIEFKYLKKEEAQSLEETQAEAKKQLLRYAENEKIKNIQNLHKYTIVAVVDELHVNSID